MLITIWLYIIFEWVEWLVELWRYRDYSRIYADDDDDDDDDYMYTQRIVNRIWVEVTEYGVWQVFGEADRREHLCVRVWVRLEMKMKIYRNKNKNEIHIRIRTTYAMNTCIYIITLTTMRMRWINVYSLNFILMCICCEKFSFQCETFCRSVRFSLFIGKFI